MNRNTNKNQPTYNNPPALTKAKAKFIRSLKLQKNRTEQGAFVAEGSKIVLEWLETGRTIKMLVATPEWAAQHGKLLALRTDIPQYIASSDELADISALQVTNHVLIIVPIPAPQPLVWGQEWYLALDGVQDPGNMGTVIRIADWFGIRHLLLSPQCVDIYNPKVVQSAMGSHLRVTAYAGDLNATLAAAPIPVFAAALEGENIYSVTKPSAGVIIIGNEAHGISAPILALANHKITIPRIGGAESLNAGVSAGIICALLLGR